jgi:hypothetical protein
MVRVRGGEAVPLRLALRFGSAPRSEVVSAGHGWSERRNRSRPNGLYLSVGWVAGEAEWQMDGLGGTEIYAVEGDGPRLAASLYSAGWELTAGADLIFLEKFAGFPGSNEYFEFFLDLTRYFRRDKTLQPFLGLRGQWNTLTLREPDGFFDDLTSEQFGGGAHLGLNIRLSRKASLELGAAYSWTGRRDLIERGDGIGSPVAALEAEDWEFASGFVVLKVGAG